MICATIRTGVFFMQNNSIAAPQNLVMENRKSLRVSGVKDIDSFTETRIVLSTIMGELVIKGEDLHVTARRGNRRLFYDRQYLILLVQPKKRDGRPD